MGIYWVDMSCVLTIFSVSIQTVPNKFEALTEYFGGFLGHFEPKIYYVNIQQVFIGAKVRQKQNPY